MKLTSKVKSEYFQADSKKYVVAMTTSASGLFFIHSFVVYLSKFTHNLHDEQMEIKIIPLTINNLILLY